MINLFRSACVNTRIMIKVLSKAKSALKLIVFFAVVFDFFFVMRRTEKLRVRNRLKFSLEKGYHELVERNCFSINDGKFGA